MTESKHSGSRAEITKSLDYFMAHDDRKTLALNGKWGSGKTSFWKKYAENCSNIKEQRHAYVSLFDIGSLVELTSKIVLHSTPHDNDEWGKKLEFIARRVRGILSGISILDNFVKSESIIAAAEESLLKGCLICLDDIERRSTDLNMGQLLGFISVLREHHGCRVLLILNENQLNEDDQAVLNKYRDKIIDMELPFRPTVRENAELALKSHKFKDLFVDVFQKFGTNNIRVMQKTLWRVERLLKIVPDNLPQAREKLTHQLAILCCFHYDENTRIDINMIRGLQSWHAMLSDKDPGDESALLAERLGALGWEYPEHENILIDIVLHEFFDEDAIKNAAKKVDAEYQDIALQDEIEGPFKKFRSDFLGNLDDIIIDLQNLLNNRIEAINFSKLHQILLLLQELGAKPDINKYQSLWVDNHPAAFSDVEELGQFLQHIESPDLQEVIKNKSKATCPKLDLVECMVKVAYDRSWGGHEDRALWAASKKDFVELMKTQTGDGLPHLFLKFLSMAINMGEREQEWTDLAERIKEALIEVAGTSRLNRIRVKKYFGSVVQIPVETAQKK